MIRTGASYFGNRYLSHALRDLETLSRSCDYVVHTVSETDLHYHRSALRKIFDATRAKGLEAWADPWGLGGVFGGEALSKFLLDHPDDWQLLSDGRRVPAACLNSRLFRDYVREWTLNVLDMGAQVVFWDEPHIFFHWDLEWEGVYSCVCPRCAELFQKKFGSKPPADLNDDARSFRREVLRDFLKELMEFSRGNKMKNALCLYAFDGNKEYERIWSELAALPPLDIFGSDPYWRWPPRVNEEPVGRVRRYAEKVRSSAGPKGSQIWIQSMRLAKGAEPEIEGAVRAAAQAGVTHLAAWSFDGGALLDTVLAEDPARVWEAVERAFQALKKPS